MRSAKTFRGFLAALALAVPAAAAPAQEPEKEAPPSADDVKKKILEIEKLMREAEDSLSRSLDTSSAEAKAEMIMRRASAALAANGFSTITLRPCAAIFST